MPFGQYCFSAVAEKIRKLPFLTVAVLVGVSSLSFFTFLGVERAALMVAFESSCRRIEKDFVYNQQKRVKDFVALCYADSAKVVDQAMASPGNSKRNLIEIINHRLSLLRVSHLAAYSPSETVQLWTNEALDNGARARLVDGEVVISRLVVGSPAVQAGLKRGDIVIAIDGIPVNDPDSLSSHSGVWEILHPDETRLFMPIEAIVMTDPIQPYWMEDQEREGVRVLRLPSFLPQAFSSREWLNVVDEFAAMNDRGDRLVIDIRGNGGGSFPAMLRAVGAFTCEETFVGWVHKGEVPPVSRAKEMKLANSLDSDMQLETLETSGAIALNAFKASSCFSGPVVVLTDENTRSVAEIFAQAMKERNRTLLMGWPTAGQVVMARWFQLEGLSPDYTISIPVAVYRSAKGEVLESRGVSPDQIPKDDLRRWRSRRDPWIAEAVKSVSF